MRNALSPAFTSSKLKFMLELMNKYGEQMTNHLDEMSKRQVKENHPGILMTKALYYLSFLSVN